jgi:hypothetical protein
MEGANASMNQSFFSISSMNTTQDTLTTHPKETAAGKLKSRTLPKDDRWHMVLTLDRKTSSNLVEMQHLACLSLPGERLFSRSTIIRRAVSLYTAQMLRAATDSHMKQLLAFEKNALLSLSQIGKSIAMEPESA